jgi:hypothetical protein
MLCALVEVTDIFKAGIVFIFCVVGLSEHAVKKQDTNLRNAGLHLKVDML